MDFNRNTTVRATGSLDEESFAAFQSAVYALARWSR